MTNFVTGLANIVGSLLGAIVRGFSEGFKNPSE